MSFYYIIQNEKFVNVLYKFHSSSWNSLSNKSRIELVEEFVKSKEIADRFNKGSALFFGEEA